MWNRLLTEIVRRLKTRLGIVLGNLFWLILHQQWGLDKIISRDPFQPKMILCENESKAWCILVYFRGDSNLLYKRQLEIAFCCLPEEVISQFEKHLPFFLLSQVL